MDTENKKDILNEELSDTEPIITPDDSIDVSERDLFGYTYSEMLPLLERCALELYDEGYRYIYFIRMIRRDWL